MKNAKLKKKPALFFALCILSFASHPVRADGLSTTFVDVEAKEVPLGVPYDLGQRQGKQLDLQNLGNTPIDVRVEVLKPSPQELRAKARAISRTDWIEIRPNHMEIPPRGKAVCDVIITVPHRWSNRHRWYQATLWSRSQSAAGQPGVNFSAGLLSRLRFKTDR